MKAGAIDFLVKPVEPDVLISAIRRALAADEKQRKGVRRQRWAVQKIELLTCREKEVLQGVVSGKINKQIAADMNIAEKTVKVHRSRMLQKLCVRSIPDLTEVARNAGLSA